MDLPDGLSMAVFVLLNQVGPVAAYALGAWVAWRALQRLPTALGVTDRDRGGSAATPWLRDGWWLAIAGLVGSAGQAVLTGLFLLAASTPQIGQWAFARATGERVLLTPSAAGWALVVAAALAAVLLSLLALRHLDWRRVDGAARLRMDGPRRVLGAVVAFSLVVLPLFAVGWFGARLLQVGASWGSAAASMRSGAPDATFGGLAGTNAGSWLDLTGTVAQGLAIVVALLAARTIVWWFEDGHRGWFTDGGGRIADWFVVLALTGLMATGMLYALDLATRLMGDVLALTEAWSGVAGQPLVGSGGDPIWSDLARLLWHALPIAVVYPWASRLMARIDWDAIEDRLAWTPSGRDRRLLWLTLAAWIAWPFQIVEMVWGMLR